MTNLQAARQAAMKKAKLTARDMDRAFGRLAHAKKIACPNQEATRQAYLAAFTAAAKANAELAAIQQEIIAAA